MQVQPLRLSDCIGHRTVTDAASAERLCRCCDLVKLQPIVFYFDIEMMYIQKGAFHKKLSLSATFEIQTGLAISEIFPEKYLSSDPMLKMPAK